MSTSFSRVAGFFGLWGKPDLFDHADDRLIVVSQIAGNGGYRIDDVLVFEVVVALEIDLRVMEAAAGPRSVPQSWRISWRSSLNVWITRRPI